MPERLNRQQWERFLRGRHVAVLGTAGADGAPLLTPIWYLYRDGKILMRTARESLKAKNIARNSRVSVCLQDERPPYKSISVYGRALIEGERPELAVEVATHYLGAIAGRAYLKVAAENIQQGEEVTIAVTPERVLSQDFARDTPAYGRLWLVAKRLLPPWL